MTDKNFLFIYLWCLWHLYGFSGRSLLGSLLLSSIGTKTPTMSEATTCLSVNVPDKPWATRGVSLPRPIHVPLPSALLQYPEIIITHQATFRITLVFPIFLKFPKFFLILPSNPQPHHSRLSLLLEKTEIIK